MKSTLLGDKMIAGIFVDAKGIFFDYLEKGKSTFGEYYVSLLQHLSDMVT